MNNRLSFTTLACPDWDIVRIVAAAVDNGYAAIDFRRRAAGVLRGGIPPGLRWASASRKMPVSIRGRMFPIGHVGICPVSSLRPWPQTAR